MAFEDVILRNDVAGVSAFFGGAGKAAVNAVGTEGYTPLFFACMKPSVSLPVIEELVRLGAAVDSRGTDGEAPLYIAVFNHRLDVAAFLLSRKAEVNAVNGPHRETALHVAARCGFTDMLSCLLDAGADLNARNARQETPLFAAASAGHHGTVHGLLVAGANDTLPNQDGKSPLFIASEKEYKHVVVLLKSPRADLKHAKALADREWQLRPTPVMSSDQMLDRAAADKQFTAAVRRRSSADAPAPDTTPMEVVRIKVPEPKARTHDPLTGASYGPCRSLEEVGYDAPPPIPQELQNRPPARLSRIGGTSMVVGTGTEEGGRQPIRVDSLGGDGVEYYVAPKS
ncbi:Ankyrin repeats (3 copies)/Ankyrin repeat/Ankyrin repeats (many copies) [Novymonas esmeraldas]|uniref:Ankyrin repeats (3 copies)/Ankyrin repeat/Ankyrin repeats (Many copies) n=1 Tax=Novymonas esmeraldas TaxID=1808958 RepID=A0AAW0EQV7_9TRYP